MADQAITALPKKTYSGSSKIAATDYLLGIDSAEGYQMLIQDLGEYIINRVTASLAGSNQTLAAAISALNSNIRHTFSNTTPLTSQLDVLASGTYTGLIGSYNHKDEVGMPANDNFFLQVYTNGSGYIDVLAYPVNNTDVYRKIKKGGTWVSDWEKQPTRAEMDAAAKVSVEGIANRLSAVSNNNVGDACFFMFDRTDGIKYKISFGTNGKLLYQKQEDGTWTTIWEK